MSVVLETIMKRMVNTKKPFEWVRDEPTEDDLRHIQKEGKESPSIYDELDLRGQMIDELQAGRAVLKTWQGPFAKVLAVVYPDTKIPWATFGKIFTAFGPPREGGAPWRIVWFAHPKKREFPSANAEGFQSRSNITNERTSQVTHVTPKHINGGYAYACAPETIVIYREEEVERVLIHELLHAACTDNMENPEWLREVLTETWAELFLVAILANGSLRKAKQLWKIQAQWIANQQHVLTTEYGVLTPDSFPWRYTVGRAAALQNLGITLPPPSSQPRADLANSLRFTSPRLV
jgi:hypothetical protein